MRNQVPQSKRSDTGDGLSLRYFSPIRIAARAGVRMRAAGRTLRARGPDHVQLWFIVLLVGSAAGLAAMLFRLGIERI